MRSHEERFAEAKRRIAARQRERRLRHSRIAGISAAAACLALIVGISCMMPGIAAKIQTGDYTDFETAGSVFHSSAALGYIVIGLLAFLARRVRDHSVLPPSAVGAGGRTGRGKRGTAWS